MELLLVRHTEQSSEVEHEEAKPKRANLGRREDYEAIHSHATLPIGIAEIGRVKTVARRLKSKAEGSEALMRTRTLHGVVSSQGVRRIKVDAKLRPGLARGFFAASKGKPYAPIGGSIDLTAKSQAQISAETLNNLRRKTEKTDEERLQESEVVPIDDSKGANIKLEPHSSIMLQVRFGDLKEAFIGRRKKLARSILIAMLGVSGNPDLYITTAEKLKETGIPRKERYLWHTKEHIKVNPNDANYSATIYYLVVTSGVEACDCRMVAITDRYMPTINSAVNGTYRTSIFDRNKDIASTFIIPILNEADHRRKSSRAGCFPLSGFPLPHSVYGKKGDDPTVRPMSVTEIRAATSASLEPQELKEELSASASRPASVIVSNDRPVSPDGRRLQALSPSMSTNSNTMNGLRLDRNQSRSSIRSSMQGSPLGSPHDEDEEKPKVYVRPRSALERAVDVTFKCTLGSVEADYNILDFKTVHIKTMKGLLKPRRKTYAHVGQQKKQLEALFGCESKDLRADRESFEDGSQPSGRESPLTHPDVETNEQNVPAARENNVGERRKSSVFSLTESEGGVGEQGIVQNTSETGQGAGEMGEAGKGTGTDDEVTKGPAMSNIAKNVPSEEKRPVTKAKRRKNAPPLKVRVQWHPFRSDLMALLSNARAVTKKLADMEYQELILPMATITGYAVLHADGPGRRLLVGGDRPQPQIHHGPPRQLLQGQILFIEAGAELPFGADAVVDPKFVVRDMNIATLSEDMYALVKDVAISGQNVDFQVRPFYIGGDPRDPTQKDSNMIRPGGYMVARDYVITRYPQLLEKYDELYSKHFSKKAQKKIHETPKIKAEHLQLHLQIIESCSSQLLQMLNVHERKELATHCRVEMFNEGTFLAKEGNNEEEQGRVMRQMYILVQGNMIINKIAASLSTQTARLAFEELPRCASTASTASYASEDLQSRVAFEANRIEEKEFGVRLGTISTPGSLFGERQLLFGEPWPVTVRSLAPYTMLVIPLPAFSKIVLQRPDMLEGMGWLMEEQSFIASSNHSDMLTVLGSHSNTATEGLQASRPASPVDMAYKLAKRRKQKEENLMNLKRMLRLDPEMMQEQSLLSKEREITDELIAIGALTNEQLAFVQQQRKEQHEEQVRRWGEPPEKRGAMGDAVSTLLLPLEQSSSGANG